MALFVFDPDLELIKLVAVNEGKRLYFADAVCAHYSAYGDIKSKVSADALLGQDPGEPFLPAGGDVKKKAFGVEPAGIMDQVRGDEYASASCGRFDQVDIVAVHDELAVGDPLFETESGDDLCVQIQDTLPELIVCNCGENAALGGKRVGQVKIERISDACIVEFIVYGDTLDQEFAPGGVSLYENLVV